MQSTPLKRHYRAALYAHSCTRVCASRPAFAAHDVPHGAPVPLLLGRRIHMLRLGPAFRGLVVRLVLGPVALCGDGTSPHNIAQTRPAAQICW